VLVAKVDQSQSHPKVKSTWKKIADGFWLCRSICSNASSFLRDSRVVFPIPAEVWQHLYPSTTGTPQTWPPFQRNSPWNSRGFRHINPAVQGSPYQKMCGL